MGSKTFGVYLAKWRHPSWKWPGRYYGCHREENANCRIFIRDGVREWFASSVRISLRRFLSSNGRNTTYPSNRGKSFHRIFPPPIVGMEIDTLGYLFRGNLLWPAFYFFSTRSSSINISSYLLFTRHWIYRDVLAIKSKRRILAKFQQIIFYFRRKRGKQKKA